MIYVTGGGGAGGTLTISAPSAVGAIITATKDNKTYTRTVNSEGIAVFKSLKTGVWNLLMTKGEQTAESNVTITADYSMPMAFFAATISVTFPVGSACTCTDGTATLTANAAQIAAGAVTFTVPNSGDWTISTTNGEKTTSKSVTITEQGQSKQVTLSYELILFDENGANTALGEGFTIKSSTDGPYMYIVTYEFSPEIYTTGTATSDNIIPFSDYSTLHIDYISSPNGGTVAAGNNAILSLTNTKKRVVKTVDISNVDDNKLSISASSLYTGAMGSTRASAVNVYKLWLT